MYPIYCGHQVIEKRMTDFGDLVVTCVSCHSTAMWARESIPPFSFQMPPPKLVGILKTGLFAVRLKQLAPPILSSQQLIKEYFGDYGFSVRQARRFDKDLVSEISITADDEAFKKNMIKISEIFNVKKEK